MEQHVLCRDTLTSQEALVLVQKQASVRVRRTEVTYIYTRIYAMHMYVGMCAQPGADIGTFIGIM